MLIPVVLSGGVGSRLWPVSRELFPKQFLPLIGETSLLVQTLQRTDAINDVSAPIIVCNDEHRFLVAEQLRQCAVQAAAILLEPEGKNTAPALAAAALQAQMIDPAAVLLVLPADHVIQQPALFAEAVARGMQAAESGHLVTFGIVPSAPETGYGYIQAGPAQDSAQSQDVLALRKFVEKPDLETARSYVASGEYLWNSGMFLLRADTYLSELEAHAPLMLAAVRNALTKARTDLDFIRLDAASFAVSPSDSIDYAVMERTQKGAVVPLSCGWSDVGSWSALWDVESKDSAENVVSGDVLLHEVGGSYIRSESRLVAAVGISNLVVVETSDAVLIADKDRVQDVKFIVKALKNSKRDEATMHKRVYRPWGSYESLVNAHRFQVKRIIVNPGQQLSLQMHHHRAEHWIVVSGTARVTCGEKEFLLSEDESTYIPLGNRHRLANPGVIPLEMIEVQTGGYLGEDDIVRFQDIYGRNE
ncbi:MAG TPA: mannose-1-phosphate guanylyltransferase/mannose-6-phosphate isomerase [Spongiibacteraceae bacterium]|nr:mannose-1-phosphate guanylyltransferase/mannose-6-phosphate isomerase [Spongiibacteraceae bacterium]